MIRQHSPPPSSNCSIRRTTGQNWAAVAARCMLTASLRSRRGACSSRSGFERLLDHNGIVQNTRREFMGACLAAGAGLAWGPVIGAPAESSGPSSRTLALNHGWRFGEKLSDRALQPAFNDGNFSTVDLPHCVSRLSWQKWETGSWATVWVYRHPFDLPPGFVGARIFLHFDGVMTGATPVINGHPLPEHLGGYLPFQYEITDLVREKGNVLAVAVDARWLNVPPDGSPRGPISVDYLEPGGIWGSVTLRAFPQVFVKDVFAKPVQVLDSSNRRVEIDCSLDAAGIPSGSTRLVASLMDGDRVVSSASKNVAIDKAGETHVPLTLADLKNVILWDTENPRLYDVVVTAFRDNQPVHDYRTRIGHPRRAIRTRRLFPERPPHATLRIEPPRVVSVRWSRDAPASVAPRCGDSASRVELQYGPLFPLPAD